MSPPSSERGASSAAPPASDLVAADGCTYRRLPLRTHWVEPGEDLADVAHRYADPVRKPGDTLLVSEKVLAVSLGMLIPAEQLRPGIVARTLARTVRSSQGPGLNAPETMQYVVQTAGAGRTLLGAAYGALQRPFGKRGGFQRVVGKWCIDIDGMCPPYEQFVIPPLSESAARDHTERLARALGMPVAILDLSDWGGSIRAVSAGLDPDLLLSALNGNPLGQRSQGTPLGLLRPIDAPTIPGGHPGEGLAPRLDDPAPILSSG